MSADWITILDLPRAVARCNEMFAAACFRSVMLRSRVDHDLRSR